MLNYKKIISFLLILVMVLSFFSAVPFSVSAADVDAVPSGDYPEIKVGDTVTVNIENGGDVAYLKFIPDRDMSISFTSVSNSNTYGYLYDADMNYIDSDDNSGSGSNFKIKYWVNAGKTYYFGAKYYYSSKTGSFDVVLSEPPVWEHKGGTFTAYNGKDNDIVIPSVIDGDTITAIGDSAFNNCTDLTGVTLPDCLKSIGWRSFDRCKGLTSVNLPDSLESIGSGAFSNCTSLTSVVIPDGITEIESNTFDGCTSLTSVTIPNSVRTIQYSAFESCISLKSVTIPENTSIWDEALGYYRDDNWNLLKVEGFTICGYEDTEAESYANENGFNFVALERPEFEFSVKNGEATITKYNGEADALTIPEMLEGYPVTGIGNNAFSYHSNLTSVIIPDSVTSIGSSAFGASGLTTIYIPDSVTSIGSYAFGGCGLTAIDIPDSVVTIDEGVFNFCDSLESVTIPASVTTIKYGAFIGCSKLTNIDIPDSVVSIGDYAFHECKSLKSVTIPASVTNIGYRSFGYFFNYDIKREDKVDGFTIYGYRGSAAKTYAVNNGFRFIAITDAIGDADGDGEVTLVDVTYIQRYNSGLKIDVDEYTMMFADVDKNGELEIIDATWIQRHLAGIFIPYTVG